MPIEQLYHVFFSPTGTSRRIVESAADGFGIPCNAIDITYAAAQPRRFSADSVVLFAVPVYGGHVAPTALERLAGLRGTGTPAAIIAVYGNRAFGKAPAELAAFLGERGFVPVAAAAFVGEHSYSTQATPIAAGRPDLHDLTQAAAFGRRVRDKIETAAKLHPIDASKLREPHTPLLPLIRFIAFAIGFRRRQKRHPVVLLPQTDPARCTHCGKCAVLCPAQAIAKGDELHTDPQRCIRCCACVKGCAFGVRSFHTPFAAALARNFSRPKQPVTLL